MAIADGTYAARAKTWALGESSKGTEQIEVSFELQTEAGGFIKWYGYFSEKAAARTIESLRIMGWAGTDLNDLTGLDNNEVEIVVASEVYDGKIKQKVQWVNKPGGVGLERQLSPEKAKAFAARMKGAVLAFDKASGATPVQANGKGKLSEKAPF